MRTLIAGLGNIFAGDDGFGSAVVQALGRVRPGWPAGTELVDFGIRGVHLAYQLLDGYDLVVLIDAVSRGGKPGTLYEIDHRPGEPIGDCAVMDAHDLGPDGVLALVPELGGRLGRVLILGCEPASIAPGMDLSATVRRSVDRAVPLVVSMVKTAAEPVATAMGGS